MKRIADLVKNYEGPNPFSDGQVRNFSDTKLSNEFCPISTFWSLFNDQHEVILGARGSGKTFLLKMMRYSMLKRVDNPQAKKLVENKSFLALYVPMHLEFVTNFSYGEMPEKRQVFLFQFAFNCMLAKSLLSELPDICECAGGGLQDIKKEVEISEAINDAWFHDGDEISGFHSLEKKIEALFYNFDIEFGNENVVPPVFRRQLCSSLLAVKSVIARAMGWGEEPTWIICIDEVEFLSELLQKCINGVFRSDSQRIALKVATLPYFHSTLETLNPNVFVSPGNDFSYRVIDMKPDGVDFTLLTDKICSQRLKSRFFPELDAQKVPDHCGLADFLGIIGGDDQIDYYREEFGPEKSTTEYITKEIIKKFSEARQEGAINYTNPRKSIHDKYAPILYVRNMYDLSKRGHNIPGWFAGSNVVRKVSQGNPRMYVQIMSELFEKARKSELSPKAQHTVIYNYASKFCEITNAMGSLGPMTARFLDDIARVLNQKVHGQYLYSAGCAFTFSFEQSTTLEANKKWIELAVAHSRLVVNDEALVGGINLNTVFLLSSPYGVKYWLPLRGDISTKVTVAGDQQNTYVVGLKADDASSQQMRIEGMFYDD